MAEVDGRSTLGNTKQNAQDLENRNPDGSLQNPTILKQAKELTSIHGKKSTRRMLCTVWCDNEEWRKSEFERIKKIWKFTTSYCCFGPIEWTEENKKPHFHMFICWTGSKKFSTIIKVTPSKYYHIDDAKTVAEAIEYCIKSNPDDVLEFGEPPKQGERTDLKKLIADNNHNINEIIFNNPEIYQRYKNGIEKSCELLEQLDNFDKWCETEEIEIEYHLGSSRCGKTYALQQICKQVKKAGVCAWILQHLNGEFYKIIGRSNTNKNPEVIVLNEFRDSKMPIDTFLELLEGKGTIPCKGGDINCIGIKKVLIASIIPPWELYNHSKRAESVESELKGRIKDNLIYHDKIDGQYITKNIKWREFIAKNDDEEY